MMTNKVQKIDQQQEIANVQDMGSAMLSMFERVILDPSVPIERIEKMMEMQERWENRQAEKSFENAVALAKSEIGPIPVNKKGHNNKWYADLAAIADVIDPILSKYGLNYRWENSEGEKIIVTCILSHRDGFKVRTTLSASPDKTGSKNDIQAQGSSLTYLERYTLRSILGLSIDGDVDDDGNAAGLGEPISTDQMENVMALVASTKTDIAAFCNYMKVDAIKNLPTNKYKAAISALEAKKGKANV